MANASIYAAFERMWQHIVAALGNKSNVDHTHDEATQEASGLMSAGDKARLDYGGIPIVTTSGSGSAYTATVDGMTALIVGAKITIIPHTVSTTTTPTLNINGLGAKYIRMPVPDNSSATSAGTVAGWLVAGRPVTVEYDGSYWKTVNMPYVKSILTAATIGTTWTGTEVPYTQTISVGGVTANSVVEISLPESATVDEVMAYQALNLQDGGQDTNSITLKSFGVLNTINIDVNIVVRSDL